jgi:predicted transport protein
VIYANKKGARIAPMKQYIGFHKPESMVFSCVVRKNSVVFYSKARFNEIKAKDLVLRDVKNIGHYTNHLPTEIVVINPTQLENRYSYFDEVYQKY